MMRSRTGKICLGLGGVLLVMLGAWFWTCLPDPLFGDTYSTVLVDRQGKLLAAAVAKDQQWRFPPLTHVPDKYIQALICFEDHRFFYHPGVDLLAVGRAIWQNIRHQRIISGASTITMQVIRLARHPKPRTFKEKLIEMAMALRLELSRSKMEILAMYAAHAPFGGNVVGLEAASWRYFGRDPHQLSWAEAAMLAVLPNSPSLIHPGKNRNILKQKRDELLTRLHENGVFDDLTLKLSIAEPLPPSPYPIPMVAPHLFHRIQALDDQSTPKRTTGTIRTTLDKSIQVQVDRIIHTHHQGLAENGIQNAAALVVRVDTGEVMAYVGNVTDFSDSDNGNYVDVIVSRRSTGSILKPFLYAGMIQAGDILPTQLVADIPTRMGGFAPENYTRTYQGAVPAAEALARSLNVPAVRMLKQFGLDRFYGLLKQLGMQTLHRPAQDYGMSLILGGAEGTLWDITGIYAGMGRCVNRFHQDPSTCQTAFFPPRFLMNTQGASNAPTSSITPLTNNNNDPAIARTAPLSPAACWLTLEAMVEVTRPGVDSAWRYFTSAGKIAWKTGTSYGYRDAWAVGVTPQYAVGVWVGNADGEGKPGLTGISAAAPILFDIFRILFPSGLNASRWFPKPEADLVERQVCASSGYLKGPYCAHVRTISIPRSSHPSRSCPYCTWIHCDSDNSYQVNADCQPLANLQTVSWFILPPAMEFYYRKAHPEYIPPPPWRPDCLTTLAQFQHPSMNLIYPSRNGRIYVPVELDGSLGRTVFEAAHREPETTIFWHLDTQYLGATKDIHHMAVAPTPGRHTLTLVDTHGEQLETRFYVLAKPKPHSSGGN